MKEKKFICPKCKTIIKQEFIDLDIENGGLGMCMCEYTDTDPKTGDVWFPKTLINYIPYNEYKIEELEKLAKDLYIEHSNWNEVLEMLPKEKLKELLELYEGAKEKDIDYPFTNKTR